MKVASLSVLLFAVFNFFSVQAQTLDTLIDVGGYKLHFIILKGKGLPILFEAGGGEDATTWNKIIRPVAERTATTLITYDRPGFGKSTFDTTSHGILNGMIGLETGLKKLVTTAISCWWHIRRAACMYNSMRPGILIK